LFATLQGVGKMGNTESRPNTRNGRCENFMRVKVKVRVRVRVSVIPQRHFPYYFRIPHAEFSHINHTLHCSGLRCSCVFAVTNTTFVYRLPARYWCADHTVTKIGLELGLGFCPHQCLHFNMRSAVLILPMAEVLKLLKSRAIACWRPAVIAALVVRRCACAGHFALGEPVACRVLVSSGLQDSSDTAAAMPCCTAHQQRPSLSCNGLITISPALSASAVAAQTAVRAARPYWASSTSILGRWTNSLLLVP